MNTNLPKYKVTIDDEYSNGEDFIVYRHRRLDTNEVFYIGIGSNLKRAYNKNKRSKFWKHITNKVEYSVEIIAENLTKELACELEKLLIKEYGRIDLGLGQLVNMTDGGEGSLGTIPHNKGIKGVYKHSKEVIEKMSGKNNPMYGVKHSDETKAIIGFKSSLKKHSSETKQKMSLTRQGGLNSQAKPIIDICSGIFYDSLNEIIELTGYSKTYLSMMLNNKKQNKTNYRYA